ncbi:hypothetical protein B9Z39_04860 [Limnohabitans sp. JirII-29]|nr:hypothetical protein B9Z41_04660 [Limnohabitans sp. JirII-31]PUE29401.1 hypothetical protein B9Z39_04860 [Limnohabitans sp. JirII-29]
MARDVSDRSACVGRAVGGRTDLMLGRTGRGAGWAASELEEAVSGVGTTAFATGGGETGAATVGAGDMDAGAGGTTCTRCGSLAHPSNHPTTPMAYHQR